MVIYLQIINRCLVRFNIRLRRDYLLIYLLRDKLLNPEHFPGCNQWSNKDSCSCTMTHNNNTDSKRTLRTRKIFTNCKTTLIPIASSFFFFFNFFSFFFTQLLSIQSTSSYFYGFTPFSHGWFCHQVYVWILNFPQLSLCCTWRSESQCLTSRGWFDFQGVRLYWRHPSPLLSPPTCPGNLRSAGQVTDLRFGGAHERASVGLRQIFGSLDYLKMFLRFQMIWDWCFVWLFTFTFFKIIFQILNSTVGDLK